MKADTVSGYFFNSVVCDMAASRNDHADLFQQVEADAGIAVGQPRQGSQHLIAGRDAQRAQAFFFIRQSPPQDGHDGLFRQGLQLDDAQARQ